MIYQFKHKWYLAALLLALCALGGCQSLYYAGITKVGVVKKPTGELELQYISGKDLQGVDAEWTCTKTEPEVCTLEVHVQDARGSESIKQNAQALREFIDATKDYADLARGLNGGL